LANDADKAIHALEEAFADGFDDPEMYASDEDLNSLRSDARFQKLMKEVMNSDEAQVQRRAATRQYERLEKQKDVYEGQWNRVGVELMRSGDYKLSEKAFDKEYKQSGDSGALYNMACVKAVSGDKTGALTFLEEAITSGSVNVEHMEEDPDLVTLHKEARFDQLVTMADLLTLRHGNNWSWGRNNDRNWKKSLANYEKVTEKYPKIGRAWFNLGYVQLEADLPKESIASFAKALDMGYQKRTTMFNLACANAQAGNTDVAFDWLKKAEDAGMQMWSRRNDDDLDPLHFDPRWREASKRWRAEAKQAKWARNDDDDDYHYHYEYDTDDDDDEDES
jgi:tetratricopeptide (TPR) repeat protein